MQYLVLERCKIETYNITNDSACDTSSGDRAGADVDGDDDSMAMTIVAVLTIASLTTVTIMTTITTLMMTMMHDDDDG